MNSYQQQFYVLYKIIEKPRKYFENENVSDCNAILIARYQSVCQCLAIV